MELKKKIRLCVVDDETAVCNLIKVLFTEFGYEVSIASSGQILFEELKKQQLPDIVLLDIMMPEMNGYDVCRKIKNDNKLKDIKVLLYTALPAYAVEEKAKEAGADGFVTKDIDPEELSRIIIKLLMK